MASRSGLASELLNRWRSAGFSLGKQSRLILHASIVENRYELKSETGLSRAQILKA